TVLLVIGAGLGIGKAVERSGAAGLIAHQLIAVMGDHPWLVLATIYGITMVLTNLITAKAAAVLIFPIAMASAENLSVQLGVPVSPMPFAIAVMMAAAASFATPVGYQTNLMVMGPGGYRASDFLRLGIPLSLLIWGLTVVLVPFLWPF
ncbi:MAG TPA: SLC13 family permease, partial [Planctomycetaceae bacterium]|nr:SLC13 family permease [Planctomycetaceae bacterium]